MNWLVLKKCYLVAIGEGGKGSSLDLGLIFWYQEIRQNKASEDRN